MAKALIIRTNGTVQAVEIGEGKYDIISDTVGGIFDSVSNNLLDIVGYVNDMGLLIGLEPNPMGTGMFGHVIVGDIVISRVNDEGETIDLGEPYFTERFASLVRQVNSDEETKQRLAEMRDMRAQEPMKIFGLDENFQVVGDEKF
ncbi:MAG: DUF3846 domain-containing protein [Planctomycetes bacterium]|nr:DUF3846 domain-containing protein [Planctomycetota bacterium]